jgi:hypothetical protein
MIDDSDAIGAAGLRMLAALLRGPTNAARRSPHHQFVFHISAKP